MSHRCSLRAPGSFWSRQAIFARPAFYLVERHRSQSTTSLSANPSPVSLGNLAWGESATGTFVIENSGPEAVSIERVETGCPCLTATPDRTRVESGRAASVIVVFKPEAGSDFEGGLSVAVTGLSAGGAIVFRNRIKLWVGPQIQGSHREQRASSLE